ncbi:hypothetical protein AB0N05_07990 [Nocardia sp. NPDC051030]|uniref:hypothetical protein n=1 Tax=Nocardia sp. NPDC051030 TaxID=3155162 RepID=UPI003434DFB3
MAPATPPVDDHVPYLFEPRRPGGPWNAVHADRAAGPEGLLRVLEASGGLLISMVQTKPPETRAFHVSGVSDPEGFAAMGIIETLVHTYDLAQGLELNWQPPADLCARVLARLFPDAPESTDPWTALLWATGRIELPTHPQRSAWMWDGTVRE